jgi:broad specificity phosphatase PhoE
VSGAEQCMRLYLVRHAASDESASGRCIGRTDVPLSLAGQTQAGTLGAEFARLAIDRIYSSPLRRATATGAAIAAASGVSVDILDDLVEIDFGAFEGLTFDDIAAANPELYRLWMDAPASVRFPQGESYAELSARAVCGLQEILRRNRGRTVVAISHGGPIRAMLAHALGIPAPAVWRFEITASNVTLIDWIGDRPVLRWLNCPSPALSAFAIKWS